MVFDMHKGVQQMIMGRVVAAFLSSPLLTSRIRRNYHLPRRGRTCSCLSVTVCPTTPHQPAEFKDGRQDYGDLPKRGASEVVQT